MTEPPPRTRAEARARAEAQARTQSSKAQRQDATRTSDSTMTTSERPVTRARTRAEARALAGAEQRRGRASDAPTRPGGRKRRRWPRRLLWTIVALGFTTLVGLVTAYALTPIPKPNDRALAESTILYYSDGKTEMARISEVNRESVPLAKVPVKVQRAFLAAEDRDFYENQGVSPTGIARAVKVAVVGGPTQGGSTITQQYVKNFYLTQDQTATRKVKEIFISVKLDRRLSKDQILDSYLNTIYFGRGADGIQTAAKAYFNKDASQLTVSEGALLASVIRGPSFYDPQEGKEQEQLARGRWAYVVDGMVSKGWLTQAERDTLKFPTTAKPQPKAKGSTGYVVEQVKKELRLKLKLTDAEIDREGLRVVTTIDKAKQQDAVNAVKKLPTKPSNLEVGLASVKPGDGAIMAMYGGEDFAKRPFNNATDANMQAGSTFKIFTLIAGLQSDLSVLNQYNGRSPQFFKEYKDPAAKTDFLRRGGVQNFGNEPFGTVDLVDATAHSVNTIFAQVNVAATPRRTMEAAAAAGVTTDLKPVYSNVFGTDYVHVIDMANAYATIAAGGVRAEPYYVKSVTSSAGDYSYKVKPVTKPVFDPPLMADVTEAMQAVVKRGTGSYAGERLDRPAAGKTGTTTSNTAALFDGFTPNMATAVGIYRPGPKGEEESMNAVPSIPGGQLTGGTAPVWIWTDYMTEALKGMPVVDFPEATHIHKENVPTTSSTTSAPTTTKPPTTTAPPTTTTTAPPTTTTTAPTTTGQPTTTTKGPTKSPTTGGGPPAEPPNP